jgi:hypothetical protein
MIWRVELQPESGRSWSGGKGNFEQKKNQAGGPHDGIHESQNRLGSARPGDQVQRSALKSHWSERHADSWTEKMETRVASALALLINVAHRWIEEPLDRLPLNRLTRDLDNEEVRWWNYKSRSWKQNPGPGPPDSAPNTDDKSRKGKERKNQIVQYPGETARQRINKNQIWTMGLETKINQTEIWAVYFINTFSHAETTRDNTL